jgi:hypothetical protein
MRLPRTRCSGHAALIEPGGVLAVECTHVLYEPVAQKFEQRSHGNQLAVLHPMRGFEQLCEQAPVLGAMLFKAGKAILLHQLLLARKVHARKPDELVEHLAHCFAAGAVHGGQMQVVDRIHEDAVLIIHGGDSDGAGVVPG